MSSGLVRDTSIKTALRKQDDAVGGLQHAVRTRTPPGQRGHGGQPDAWIFSHPNQRLNNWHGSCIGKEILHET